MILPKILVVGLSFVRLCSSLLMLLLMFLFLFQNLIILLLDVYGDHNL